MITYAVMSIQVDLVADHDRLDRCFARFRRLKRTCFSEARECFEDFKQSLERHMDWEEEILFPLFQTKTGLRGGGPIEALRAEHQAIRDLLEQVAGRLQTEDSETDHAETALFDIWSAHVMKEEHLVYPILDRVLNDDEKAELRAAMLVQDGGTQP